MRNILSATALSILLALPLGACVNGGADGGGTPATEKSDFVSEPVMLAEKGIELIGKGSYDKASAIFNLALKLDTTNSYLQFLNGLAYHLRALQGDVSLYPMAQQGYELAVQFDKSNWLANFHLGMLYMDQKKYPEAIEYLAEAALYNEQDPDILYSLAVASYYNQDPKTAAGILEQLQREIPESLKEADRYLSASSVTMAALGHGDKAEEYLLRYKKIIENPAKAKRLERRIKEWRGFHQRSQRPKPTQVAAQLSELPKMEADPKAKVQVAELSNQASENGEEARPEYDPLAEDQEDGDASEEEEAVDENRMVIVDVVIIRTEEDLTTSKGVNLLNGLTLQFGITDESTSGYAFKKSKAVANGNWTSTITRAIGVKSIDYSLNIANANSTRNEILARPTLVALAGQQSEFFSGVEVDAAAVGGSSSDGATVTIQKEIGVKLTLTPEFLEDGRIRIAVTAERTFLTTPNTTSITFSLRVDTSKTTVNANVAMNVGETLILSGLSEKETERKRDGVPLLQDIPGLQYLFSNATTRDFQKSVLILLTPRLPNYTYQSDDARNRAERNMSPSEKALSEFQARYSDWFKPYPNWASVFHHMQNNKLYREFRTGDVTLERWANQSTLKRRLREVIQFLHY